MPDTLGGPFAWIAAALVTVLSAVALAARRAAGRRAHARRPSSWTHART
ncbi:hypothetical protein [Streptomyces sp. NPDC090022]